MTSKARSTGPATHAAAVATAQARAVSLGLDLARYRVEITEEEDPAIYVVQLIAKDKPQGHRGALAALPEPVFKIDKSSGAVVEQHFSR